MAQKPKTKYPERRLQLHKLLCKILGSDQVYFQPPESIRMTYPAIVYSLDNVTSFHADDRVYSSDRKFQIIFISPDPDEETIGKILQIPTCNYNRHYNSDNLNHDVFTIYF